MTGKKANLISHQPGVWIATVGARKVSQGWTIMFLLEAICVLLLFLATGCLSLVFREGIEMPKIYSCLEIGQILLMLLLIAISSWAAHPMLQSHGRVLLMQGVSLLQLLQKEMVRHTKDIKEKENLEGCFSSPSHGRCIANQWLIWD